MSSDLIKVVFCALRTRIWFDFAEIVIGQELKLIGLLHKW